MSEYPTERVFDSFVKVDRITTPSGKKREIVVSHNAVAILLYHLQSDCVVLINQQRVAMISEENPEGMITEIVAGLFDLEIGIKELMVKEVEEEAGISLTEEQIELVNNGMPLASTPGGNTEKIYLGYAEINSEQIDTSRRIFGVEEEGERITRTFIPAEELESIAFDDMKTWALVQWFLKSKKGS